MLYDSSALIFLSTLSLRRATYAGHKLFGLLPISIHALLAESDKKEAEAYIAKLISIHALLAESDLGAKRRPCMGRISIHALLAESD